MYNRNNNRSRQRQFDPNKEIRFIHTPFTLDIFENDKETLGASCDKDGKITVTHTDKLTNEYEEVVIPASAIFKLVNMLEITRKVKYQDRARPNDTTDRTTTEG